MPEGKRLWRTAEGGLVMDGHPGAVVLAYGPNDRLEGSDKMPSEKSRDRVERPDGRASAEKWLAYAESAGVSVPAGSREDKAAIRALVDEQDKAAQKAPDKQAEKATDKQAAKPADK